MSRVRVALDVTSVLAGQPTGVGRFTYELWTALGNERGVGLVPFSLSWRGRRSLRAESSACLGAVIDGPPAGAAHAAWRIAGRPRIDRWVGAVDVVHGTNFVAPPTRGPVVVTVHDAGFVRHPKWSPRGARRYRSLLRRAVGDGAYVHVHTALTAREVAELFDISSDRILHVEPGVRPARLGSAARGRRLAGGDRYVLALGALEPRKNLPRLIQAFDQVATGDSELRLVLAGPEGIGSAAVRRAIATTHAPDRVSRLGYVDAYERDDLLAGASVLAYPSLYEGFGFPPLEAMAVDVPVLAADIEPLREVLESAALFVDPLDVDAIGDGLRQILAGPDLRAELSRRGRERVAHHRWDLAAARFLECYEALASG